MSSISETLKRRDSVVSLNTPQIPTRERSNSISSMLHSRRNSVVSVKEEKEEKPVKPIKHVQIEEAKCGKTGLKSLQQMVDMLTQKLQKFEEQFKRDKEQISHQNKEITELKNSIKDIIDG